MKEYIMFRHNLLIIFRNFKRNKSSFFINLIGLSTGLACALLIYLWVNDELQVDKFHKNDKQLFQVMKNGKSADGRILTFEWTPGPLADALAEEMPEVERAVTVMPNVNATMGIISACETHIKASEKYVGQDFFNVFSYNLIDGDKNLVLLDKNAVVISDELARKLFNSTQNIVGKTVEWSQGELGGVYSVTGIFQKPPANSTAQFDLLFSFELFRSINTYVDEWTYGGPSTYIVLRKGTNLEHFNEKIGGFLQQKTNEESQSLFIRRYSNKYLFGKYENGVQAGGRIVYVRLFSIIALFILAIACINFMNLSTAKVSRRMKEVGVKKTVGASKITLMFQYLGEAMLIAFLSLIIAILLVELLLPQYNAITGKHLDLNFNLNLILSILGITFFTGLISGSYPAIYLSSFNPATILKGKMKTSISELLARKGLVIFQFIISIILIVSVLVVYKQITFIQSKNLGFDKDNIISFKKEGRLEESLETFLYEVKNIPGVINASNYHPNLTVNLTGTYWVNWQGKNPEDKVSFKYLFAGYDFIEALGIELKEGRSFSREFGTDDSKIIFNETAIKSMGLANPVGQTINLWGENKQIVGVVKDFHFESLYENLKPCFLLFSPNEDNIIVKIKAGTERATIARIQKFYKEFNQGLPFDFKFLDEDFQALYESEIRVGVLSRYFAGIAIIISCLGLFGLAAFSAERRRKEIGIRKVLGSSVPRIIFLLSGDFTKIVLASIVISLPVSFFIAKHWLDSFAYRIDLKVWYFVGAGILTLFIAWITVGTQAIRAALANPVESLRYE
jgi:putative ABC transport system permease protein